MKGTGDIKRESGMSKSRCIQFAKEHNLPRIGTAYVWDEEAEKLFYERIGQRGKYARTVKDSVSETE